MTPVLHIAIGHLEGRPRQAIVSILGVMLGVGFFIGLAAMMQGLQQDFINKIISITPHVVIKDEFRNPPEQPVFAVYPKGAVRLENVKPRQEVRGLRNGQRMLAQISAMPGVRAAPSLETQGIVRYGSEELAITLVGVQPQQEVHVSTIEDDMQVGSLQDLLTTGNGVVLGVGVGEKLGAQLGDVLSVVSPAGIVMRMKVVGIFSTGISALDNQEAYILLKKAQVLSQRQNVINRIRLKLADFKQSAQLAQQLEKRYRYRTEGWEEINKNVLSIFVVQNGVIYSSVMAILIVACFGIFNIISTVIMEKQKDIAILMSMGFEKRDIERIFVLQGLVIGVIGTILGWGVGYTLCLLLDQVPIEVKEGAFVRLEGFVIMYWWGHYAIAGGIAITSAVLAAYLPSRKAALLRPVDIIRGAS